MLSSRATLEGYGVGNASASATDALLLSVLQDIFGRLITIAAAYYFGSSLMPEAKTYRFLADVLIDIAIVLDTLSPLLASMPIFVALTDTIPIPFRVYTLFLSSAFRALCGIAAGGSKTAISLHFATPLEGTGNLGDLNAKDASKETVLSLLGMLLGTVIVPNLTTPFLTYTALLILIIAHLSINYAAVRGIQFRTLNRQRASIAWIGYRDGPHRSRRPDEPSRPYYYMTPYGVAQSERIFHKPDRICDGSKTLARCTIGSSFGSAVSVSALSHGRVSGFLENVLDIFSKEQYILWFDPAYLASPTSSFRATGRPHIHICLKEGYTPSDQLKAWLNATEVARMLEKQRWDLWDRTLRALRENVVLATPTSEALIATAYQLINDQYADFVKTMHEVGWISTNESKLELSVALLPGPPESVVLGFIDGEDDYEGDENMVVEAKKVI
ncbi:hypothetical protein VNI00_010479 [Paramarasmius palmivorus]|uniref:DUF647-domain-containing protein n=1 Tax=Paramarasmius palmivorus TaxID=297713 RepID=A0AAW0CKC3_9AGAR